MSTLCSHSFTPLQSSQHPQYKHSSLVLMCPNTHIPSCPIPAHLLAWTHTATSSRNAFCYLSVQSLHTSEPPPMLLEASFTRPLLPKHSPFISCSFCSPIISSKCNIDALISNPNPFCLSQTRSRIRLCSPTAWGFPKPSKAGGVATNLNKDSLYTRSKK